MLCYLFSERVKCGRAPSIQYGVYSIETARPGDNHTELIEGDTALYSCPPDDKLVGEGRLKCNSNGLFSPGPPSCVPKPTRHLSSNAPRLCPSPDLPEGASFVHVATVGYGRVGDSVTVRCGRGHCVVDKDEDGDDQYYEKLDITCLERGAWSGEQISCKGRTKYKTKANQDSW